LLSLKGAPLSADQIPHSWKSPKRSFFAQPPEIVAPQLLGVILAHHTPAGLLAGQRRVSREAKTLVRLVDVAQRERPGRQA